MAFWILSGNLVYFPRFGKFYQKNLATLIKSGTNQPTSHFTTTTPVM
jgi:hypothetical protein